MGILYKIRHFVGNYFVTPYYAEFNFDVAMRYMPARLLLEKKKYKHILDIGSGERGLAQFTDRMIYGLDAVFESPSGNMVPVEGSVLNLPFDDSSFDFVVSVDVMEHLTQELRQQAFNEILRVSSDTVIIGCPADRKAEEIDRATLKKYFHNNREKAVWWLKDHVANGLPSAADLEAFIVKAAEKNEKRVIIKREGNINISLYKVFINLFMEQRRIFFPVLSRRMVRYLKYFYRIFNFGQTYRTIYVINVAKGR
jgi:SAM-dependent methyltransferase